MLDVIYRKAQKSDVRGIALAIALSFKDDFESIEKNTKKLARSLENGINIHCFYVAEVDGIIAGVAACSDCDGRAVTPTRKDLIQHYGFVKGNIAMYFYKEDFMRPLRFAKTTGFIEFVGVRPEYQANGIAGKLIEFLIQDSDYKKFILDVVDTNYNAQKSYSRIGFREYKRVSVKHPKIQGYSAKIFMSRPKILNSHES